MQSLVKFWNCGTVTEKNKSACGGFPITRLIDLLDRIIPFFNKYRIQGAKSKDFADFCKIAVLMKNKAHLTQDGPEEIIKIKSGMNTGREFDESN